MSAKSDRQRQEERRRRRGVKPKPDLYLMTQSEVATLLGITRQQVSRDEKRALEKISLVLFKGL